MDIRNILGKLDQLTEGTMAAAKKKDTGPKFTGKMKGTDPASAAKDKYVGEGSILRDLEAKLNEEPEKRDLMKEFREFKEGATGAKPGWMLRQDPALAKKLKDQQARKKYVPGKPTPNKEQSVEEARAASAAFRSGNDRRAALNAMSPEERAEYDRKRAEQQRKRDDARLERERSKNKGVAEGADAQWIPDVVRLLGKLVLSNKAQAKYNVEPADIPDIKEFINLLSAGNLDAARDHWLMMEWNDLDNALEYFVRKNGLPHIWLHKLLGEQGLEEAAKGILHRVRYSYDDPSGNGTASGHITLHAPDKVSAARYATSDLTKRGKKNVQVHAVTPQKVAEEFTDLDRAVMEGGHELVKEAPVAPVAGQPAQPGKPTLGADLSKPAGQQNAQQQPDQQAQQLAAQKEKQQQATLQKGVNDLKAAGAAVSNPAQVVKAFDKAEDNQGLTPGDKNSIASAGTVLAPIMANPQLQGKFKDLVTQASAAQKKEQQQQAQQPNAVGQVK